MCVGVHDALVSCPFLGFPTLFDAMRPTPWLVIDIKSHGSLQFQEHHQLAGQFCVMVIIIIIIALVLVGNVRVHFFFLVEVNWCHFGIRRLYFNGVK